MIPSFKGLTGALDKLKHDLELQAAPLQAEIESIGQEAADAIVKAKSKVAQVRAGVEDIKAFVASLEAGSNGGPSLTGSSASSGGSAPAADAPAAPAAAEAPDVSATPQLTVNGVSTSS